MMIEENVINHCTSHAQAWYDTYLDNQADALSQHPGHIHGYIIEAAFEIDSVQLSPMKSLKSTSSDRAATFPNQYSTVRCVRVGRVLRSEAPPHVEAMLLTADADVWSPRKESMDGPLPMLIAYSARSTLQSAQASSVTGAMWASVQVERAMEPTASPQLSPHVRPRDGESNTIAGRVRNHLNSLSKHLGVLAKRMHDVSDRLAATESDVLHRGGYPSAEEEMPGSVLHAVSDAVEETLRRAGRVAHRMERVQGHLTAAEEQYHSAVAAPPAAIHFPTESLFTTGPPSMGATDPMAAPRSPPQPYRHHDRATTDTITAPSWPPSVASLDEAPFAHRPMPSNHDASRGLSVAQVRSLDHAPLPPPPPIGEDDVQSVGVASMHTCDDGEGVAAMGSASPRAVVPPSVIGEVPPPSPPHMVSSVETAEQVEESVAQLMNFFSTIRTQL